MKVIKFATEIIVGCAVLGLGLCAAPPASADSVVFTEDFGTDFHQWEQVRPNGADWRIVDGQAEAYVAASSKIIELVPKDDFWDQTLTNFEYQLEYTPLEGVDKNISFNFIDAQHWYEVHFTEHSYNLVRLSDGYTPFTVFNPYSMVNGLTYRLRIRFEDGRIRIWVNDTLIGDEVDQTFDHRYGKIGIKAGTGAVAPTRVRFDNVRVIALSAAGDLFLNVPMVKQANPQWTATEYDKAAQWSNNPGIGRWGCALSSAVMILQHYGISKLPTGETLNPATLNNWLNQQADGYLGQGLLNWQAITRLTQLASADQGTPKLEYRAVVGESLEVAKQEIRQRRPTILQITGHFLVGAGIRISDDDIIINDPAYTLTRFGQHKTPLLSTRIFTPSQTDLSYLLILHQPSTQVTIVDSSGQPLSGVVTVIEQIGDATARQTRTSALAITQLAKPNAGQYQLSFTAATNDQVRVLAYDQTAQLSEFTQPATAGRTETLELNFQKNGPTTLVEKTNWAALIQAIHDGNQRRGFIHPAEPALWLRLIKQVEKKPLAQQRQLLHYFQISLLLAPRRMTPVTRQQLWAALQIVHQALRRQYS